LTQVSGESLTSSKNQSL